MKLYAILITVVIIIIYVSISCRYYIAAYLKHLKKELKYIKDKNKSLKTDLKTRYLPNKTIENGIELLDKELKSIGYKYKGEFIIPDNLRRELVYSKYSERTLKKLFALITQHMGITDQGVELEVKNVSSKIRRSYAGLYNEGSETTDKKISIFVNPDYSYETVVSIIIHESTHYFLLSNGIRVKDRKMNEYLTDLATIYLGFGKYMLEGYKQTKKLIFVSELTRTTIGHKVGYLNYSDVKHTMKVIKKIRKNK